MRRCCDPLSRGCVTVLNSFNNGPECGPCAMALYTRQATQARQQRERAERVSRRIPVTKPGTLTARILDALPGDVYEVAERVGHERQRVSSLLSNLVIDGRVISERVGDDGHYVYTRRVLPEAEAA